MKIYVGTKQQNKFDSRSHKLNNVIDKRNLVLTTYTENKLGDKKNERKVINKK
jgi:hypothetical protein